MPRYRELIWTLIKNPKPKIKNLLKEWPGYCLRNDMNTYDLKLEAPWQEVKERLKEVNIELTDEDLVYTPGKENELLERLAKKMHRDVPAIKAWVESVSFNKGKAS
jgi:hypothetical protein